MTRASDASGLRPFLAGRRAIRLLLMVLCLGVAALMVAPAAHAEDTDWDSVVEQMTETIQQVPDQYAAGDTEGVETSIRKAYYETYQVSGLEAQIDHRLGTDRADAFVTQLLALRDLARNAASQSEVEEATTATVDLLRADVADLAATPELNDQWTRVGQRIIERIEAAKTAYAQGDYESAASAARDAYLAHYEADGLEKATISYIGQSRVTDLESMFTQLRQDGRDGSLSVEDYAAKADELTAAITQDAAQLDEMTSRDELGWSGFWASFLVLVREGAEALLVVAALVTYAMKAGRRDQLVGIMTGVVAALAISIGLAVLFSRLASSATSGFSQELLEGITGLLAVIMLIWVSNWILSKASGARFQEYIDRTASKGVAAGGSFALASAAFLAVLREGSETILFFAPIIAGAKTGGDHAKIWMGVGAAVALLALLFTLVWVFGVRLPLRPFFTWTSVLLGILSVTIAGGAVKEFQDATLVSQTLVPGVPQVTILGLYPTAETLAAQLAVVAILVVLAVLQRRKSRAEKRGAHVPDPAAVTQR
ncbi:FTR1 family protein [Schaalia naturae]|uniref:FTR1 family protein n=1 Tax=Schaalia naturae TaxID=635203 RepID=A0ABW2SQG4_9ACTO